MNEKQKVLESLKKHKAYAEKVARDNFCAAMENAEYKKLYLETRALSFEIAKCEFEKTCFEFFHCAVKMISGSFQLSILTCVSEMILCVFL